MSSVKIKGSPTGTANFTIAVPDGTSTDRTIELPDAAGSFVTADASGNVGVGTTSPEAKLHIYESDVRAPAADADDLVIEKTGDTGLSILSTTTGRIYFGDAAGEDQGSIRYVHSDDSMRFETNSAEAMRIDSSGNLLVGTTSTTLTGSAGFTYQGGITTTSNNGSLSAIMNRNTNDGDIVQFRKDNSAVGSIASGSGRLAIGDRSASLRFVDASQKRISPFNITSLSDYDALIDLGESGSRFQDIFATNGTIQTSDATEKQQIALLTDDEITAAKAISKLFKTFKWNSAVEAKGDAARTHTGVIAQEVQQVMTDAGLDAGNYAFFIRGVWWETQTEVPAVAEELDEDGNVITEAAEAYTRTETYDTAEEAPEGATQRTRLGIRYPELLSFIGAATEQRLASIEARLDALEAV